MAYKNPLTEVSELSSVTSKAYNLNLKKVLNSKLEDGGSLPFSIIFNHVYPDKKNLTGLKLPFLLLGNPMSSSGWNAFKKSKTKEGKNQKKFMACGNCKRDGSSLTLTFDGTALKKIPNKLIPILQKLVKTRTPHKFTITFKEEAPKTEEAGAAAGAAVGGDTKQDKNTDTKPKTAPESKEKPKVSEEQKEKLVNKYKEEKQEEAKKLGEQFKELNTMSSSASIKKVTANIKKGRTTKKDLKAVKALNKVFSTTEKLYKGTAKQIQKKFEKPYKELSKNKKKFYQLSLATKQSKKSLAETLASFYYEKKEDRVATKDEVKEIQKIIKDVILMNKKRRKKAKQAMLFQVTAEVLRKEGPKDFKAKYVNKILQEKLK